MAVVVMQESREMTAEIYDEVMRQVGMDPPPEGLILHTAGQDGEVFRVVDVWESREAHDRFADERLRPAIAHVARERGHQPEDPAPHFYEAHAALAGAS